MAGRCCDAERGGGCRTKPDQEPHRRPEPVSGTHPIHSTRHFSGSPFRSIPGPSLSLPLLVSPSAGASPVPSLLTAHHLVASASCCPSACLGALGGGVQDPNAAGTKHRGQLFLLHHVHDDQLGGRCGGALPRLDHARHLPHQGKEMRNATPSDTTQGRTRGTPRARQRWQPALIAMEKRNCWWPEKQATGVVEAGQEWEADGGLGCLGSSRRRMAPCSPLTPAAFLPRRRPCCAARGSRRLHQGHGGPHGSFRGSSVKGFGSGGVGGGGRARVVCLWCATVSPSAEGLTVCRCRRYLRGSVAWSLPMVCPWCALWCACRTRCWW